LSDNSDIAGVRSERVDRLAPHFSYTEVFNTQFPYYLSIGMTEEQYWDKDSMLPKYYREAAELRQDRMNQELWLQGMYIYDAMSRLAPIFQAFGGKGAKAEPYVEKPYPINSKDIEAAEELKEKKTAEKGLRFMKAFATSANKQFEGKEVSENADNDRVT